METVCYNGEEITREEFDAIVAAEEAEIEEENNAKDELKRKYRDKGIDSSLIPEHIWSMLK